MLGNIFIFKYGKGTDSVILSDYSSKDDNARFTIVPLKPESNQ